MSKFSRITIIGYFCFAQNRVTPAARPRYNMQIYKNKQQISAHLLNTTQHVVAATGPSVSLCSEIGRWRAASCYLHVEFKQTRHRWQLTGWFDRRDYGHLANAG